MSIAAHTLVKARLALVMDHPFFGALALRLTHVASEQIETMATDGVSLLYNPVFVDSLSRAELVGVYAHEVMHCAMLHHTRRENRDMGRWNEACDHAINPVLKASGFSLPEGALLDPAYAGLSAEQVYGRLPVPPPGGEGKPKQPGQVLDAPGEAAEESAEWQVAVKQAIQTAKAMGSLPAGIAEEIAKATAPKADWRAILRRFVQQSAAADFSWRQPNRRYVASGLYLPSLASESLPPIAVILDTSGSTQSVMKEFVGELQDIVNECRPERTYLLEVDAKVHRVSEYEPGDSFADFSPVGLGGTKFEPGFDWLDENQVSPVCAIYLTDGEGHFPENPPPYPVLWAISTAIVAPFGETVRIEVRP